MEKTQWKERIIYGIKIKWREARQNWKEEGKKIRNREKDYRRWRSVNQNERRAKQKKWEKKVKLKRSIRKHLE